MLYTIVTVVILLVCALLVLFVLVQNAKGGGLVSSLGGASNVVGVRESANILEKGTWTLAVVLMLLSFFAVAALPHQDSGSAESRIQQQVQRTESGTMPMQRPDVPSTEELPEQPKTPPASAE